MIMQIWKEYLSHANNLKKYFSINMLKDRLDLIIKELGLSGRQFEKECGLPSGSYSSISDGVGANKLKQILYQISANLIGLGNYGNRANVQK